ncbi:MAG: c-type cytochrome [Spirochaetaceae bacterium]|nr:c-type cytochrome [Myxococcales bacterium]MCB9722655.1 c-type cytochrome [Spirochaetaceae bacterium]
MAPSRNPILATLLPALALLTAVAPRPAVAQASPPAATGDWVASVAEAAQATRRVSDLERGRLLYAVCAECHLDDGVGEPDGTMPQLAGQHRSVLVKQLLDIRSGVRHNPPMYPYAAQLDGVRDVVDVAGYVASLPPPSEVGVGPGTALERGRALYEASCQRCHGAQGEGSADAFHPRIGGQHYRYMVRQLIDIASGRRANAHPDMVLVVSEFSARDVSAVADWVSRRSAPDSSPAR